MSGIVKVYLPFRFRNHLDGERAMEALERGDPIPPGLSIPPFEEGKNEYHCTQEYLDAPYEIGYIRRLP